MEKTTNMKGQFAVSKAELRALELGYIPSRPSLDTRYDLILDNYKQLMRIQVKYADGKPSASTGAVIVKLAYENRRKKVSTYKKNEIDGLLVYIPKTDRICLLPPEIFVGKRNLCIRISKPKNNQLKGILFAEDYYW